MYAPVSVFTLPPRPFRRIFVQWSRTSRFVVEFLCLALPPLLCMTIAADAVPLVLGVQFAVCLLLHVASLITQSVPLLSVHLSPWHASHLLAAERRKSFVSSYRSGIMLCTYVLHGAGVCSARPVRTAGVVRIRNIICALLSIAHLPGTQLSACALALAVHAAGLRYLP
ncbi:hypothetical protein EON66_10840 [archaeon]|nr:MAG: hypothetical protein EON66_10840 [archaeon]